MKILILNSAQGKYPSGGDSWVRATVTLCEKFAGDNVTLICSTDPAQWNLVTYLAGKHRTSIELIVKADNNPTGRAEFLHILKEYQLDASRIKPLYCDETSENHAQTKKLWQVRDRIAVSFADVIYPVSIRSGGRLDRLLNFDTIQPKVWNTFRADWKSDGYKPRYTLRGRKIEPLPPGKWLVHWTRSSQGPWPGEPAWHYYRDLLDNPSRYVRNAEATLARILREQLVRGSSWKMSGGKRAVAFTALSVEDAIPLMRWRKRYVRYTFEPYGIAIKRSALIDYGARPVKYVNDINVNIETDRLYTHASGEKTDWTQEKEWRISGDFSLKRIDCRDLIAIVPDVKAKKELLKKIHDIYVHVMFE